ncbi:MAG TPA: ATP-grasp domain-containing protein [Stellaceae bacterium]|nr:ATP-grasp domain-containing protein [Stellaceae bacterium]
MPTARRSTSLREARPALIAALSGRALAAAAARAGERAIVLDLFADRDTARHAKACVALPRGPYGFARKAVLEAVARRAGEVRGLVYGAGFEHDPALLGDIAKLVSLLGNSPETVAAAKDPLAFAALLARLGLPHPPTTREPPHGDGWLRKSIGGSGGGHIAPASVAAPDAGDFYFQKRVAGRAVSAAFLADGRSAHVLGFSEQWIAGDAASPFRYGGCAGPVPLPPALAAAIEAACHAIASALGLIGLNSLDLLIDGDGFHIIEVNPRPGATLDIFDGQRGISLWRLHLDAVAGRLPSVPSDAPAETRAAAVVYAAERIVIPAAMAWPAWTADRGTAGTIVDRGEPVCTVRARAATARAARDHAERRGARLLAQLAAGQYPHT